MKYSLILSSLLLFGCSIAEATGPEKKAEQAISKGDYRLYRLQVRGNVLPGIEVSERSLASELCGVQHIDGTGDVIRTEESLRERQKRIHFAAKYNTIVYQACKSKRVR